MRLAKAEGLRLGSEDVYEAKFGGHIVWPIWQLSASTTSLYFRASGGETIVYISGRARNEDGERITELDVIEIDAREFTITKRNPSHDQYNQISYELVENPNHLPGVTKYLIKFKGDYLEDDERQALTDVTYRIAWKDTEIDIVIAQEANTYRVIQQHLVTTGYGNLILWPVPSGAAINEVPITGGRYTITGTTISNHVTDEYVWTSGYRSGGTVDQYGILTSGVYPNANAPDRTDEYISWVRKGDPPLPPGPSVSVETTDIIFGTNELHDYDIDYDIYAYFQGDYDPEPIRGHCDMSQEADYIDGYDHEVNPDFPYQAYITMYHTASFTPKGVDVTIEGAPSLEVRAWHEERDITVWHSGARVPGNWYDKEDQWAISQDEGVVQQYHFPIGSWSGPDENGKYTALVGHTNMEDRSEDKVQFMLENLGDITRETYSFFPREQYQYITVRNAVVSDVYDDTFSLNIEDATIGPMGGDVNVYYQAFQTRTTTWQSDYVRQYVYQEYLMSFTTDYGTIVETSTRGLATLTVPPNPNFATRRVTVNMYNAGLVNKGSDYIDQEPHVPVYTMVLDETSWGFRANGSSNAGYVFTLIV